MSINKHNHAAYKTDETGRFVILKSLHFGCRGNAGSEYILHDTEGRMKDGCLSNLTLCKCYVAKYRDGLECAPWFGSSAKNGHIKDQNVQLIPLEEWAEIKGLLPVVQPDVEPREMPSNQSTTVTRGRQ